MHQDISSQPTATADDIWSRCLPGFKLTHRIYLVADDNLEVVASAASRLHRERVSVRSWAMTKRDGVFEHKIAFDDVGERQARTLREQLLEIEHVLRARLEHSFARGRE